MGRVFTTGVLLLYGCVQNDENALGGHPILQAVARTSRNIHCDTVKLSTRRSRSSNASIQRPETHKGNTMDGQIFQITEGARGLPPCSQSRVT